MSGEGAELDLKGQLNITVLFVRFALNLEWVLTPLFPFSTLKGFLWGAEPCESLPS